MQALFWGLTTTVPPEAVLATLPNLRSATLTSESGETTTTRDAAEALRKHHPPHVEILPLFARLSAQDQERVFKTTNARRIVLATNVAETSLTVPGIRYVVDAGTARVKRYSYRNKVEQLQVEPVAQSAANQRVEQVARHAGKSLSIALSKLLRIIVRHQHTPQSKQHLRPLRQQRRTEPARIRHGDPRLPAAAQCLPDPHP